MEMSVLACNNADVSTRIDGSNDGTTGATAMEKEIQRYINLYLNILN